MSEEEVKPIMIQYVPVEYCGVPSFVMPQETVESMCNLYNQAILRMAHFAPLRHHRDSLAYENEQLRKLLTESKTKETVLLCQIIDMQKELKDCKLLVSELEKELCETKSVTEFEGQISQFKKYIEKEILAIRSAMKEKSCLLNKRCGKLEDDKKMLEQEKKNNNRIGSLETLVAKKSKQIEELKAQVEDLENHKTACSAILSAQDKEMEELHKVVEDYKQRDGDPQEVWLMRLKFKDLQLVNEELRTENDELKVQNCELELQYQRFCTEILGDSAKSECLQRLIKRCALKTLAGEDDGLDSAEEFAARLLLNRKIEDLQKEVEHCRDYIPLCAILLYELCTSVTHKASYVIPADHLRKIYLVVATHLWKDCEIHASQLKDSHMLQINVETLKTAFKNTTWTARNEKQKYVRLRYAEGQVFCETIDSDDIPLLAHSRTDVGVHENNAFEFARVGMILLSALALAKCKNPHCISDPLFVSFADSILPLSDHVLKYKDTDPSCEPLVCSVLSGISIIKSWKPFLDQNNIDEWKKSPVVKKGDSFAVACFKRRMMHANPMDFIQEAINSAKKL